MKILMVSEDVPHPAMGGLGKHAVTLTQALAAAGHQVDFMGSQRFSYDDVARHEIKLPGQFFPDLWWRFGSWKEPKLGFFNPLRRTVLAREFARIILARASGYDVIHYHGHVPDVAAFIPDSVNFVQTRHDQGSDCLTHMRFKQGAVCTATEPGACASCATSEPNALQGSLSTLAVRQYRKRVCNGFVEHKVVFVSEMLRTNLARTFAHKQFGVVIHNFLDYKLLRDVIANSSTGQQRTHTQIFIAAKLYEPKGVEPLLEILHERLPQFMHLKVAGNGPDEARLRAKYSGASIEFTGWKNYHDTLCLTANADIVIVPSIWEEAFGTTTLEGLALGKPVHALNRGGTPELQRYERYPGQLNLHNDMDALANAVLAGHKAPDLDLKSDFSGDVSHRLVELLEVYGMDKATFADISLHSQT